MKRLLFFFVVAITLHNVAFANQSKALPSNNDAWVLDTVIQNVSFYHQLVSCNGKNAVLLKFVNNSTTSVKVSWKEACQTLQNTNEIESFSGLKELVIPTGTTEASNCNDTANKKCIISAFDVHPAFIADITSFKFINPTVGTN